MKLSVSITTYNHEGFIAQAIESALNQKTTFDYEIIIGEDDSSDKTREIVKKYKNKYPDKIKLFLNDRKNVIYVDGKPTGRWNFVNNLKSAKGQYIALLDGDDYWTDSFKLQKQVDFLDSHPECSICFHAFRKTGEVPENNQPIFPPGRKPIYTIEDILKCTFISTLSVVFRNGLFEDFPEWFFRMPQADWPLHILNSQHGDIGYIDEVMGVYRVHKGGIWMADGHIEALKKTIKSIKIINPFLSGEHQTINMRTCYRLNALSAYMSENEGNIREARSFAKNCYSLRTHEYGSRLDTFMLLLRFYAPWLWKLQRFFRPLKRWRDSETLLTLWDSK